MFICLDATWVLSHRRCLRRCRGRAREHQPSLGHGKARVMTLTSFALRNLARNKFRVVLTILGVGVAILAFLLLRTVIWVWASGAERAAKNRIVTRDKVTFVMPLPR